MINEAWQEREERNKQDIQKRLARLNAYEIECVEYGGKYGKSWTIIKDGQRLSKKDHPELYALLNEYGEHLAKDQYTMKELKINRYEVTYFPGAGGLLGHLGAIDKLMKGIGTLKVGQQFLDQLRNAPSLVLIEKTELADWERDNRVPKDNETVLAEEDYKRTSKKVKGAVVYEKDGKSYHRDTLHKGKGAHLEVYDKARNHLGEADPKTGEIIPGTQDKKKKLPK
ncbi:colicin E3/pyocin S6 family cytotoxin [uncultured Enterococcus sp.]|uniref:colicin E3/pyocin S6 family cytotoxin n=1 Tax=uncultured Enterococcus sp. TaxID=167972 RepID=UPI002AA7084F|nr:colicin E3/pyocin S6 family cytotoxin [uncultured Enterococcus sp.]